MGASLSKRGNKHARTRTSTNRSKTGRSSTRRSTSAIVSKNGGSTNETSERSTTRRSSCSAPPASKSTTKKRGRRARGRGVQKTRRGRRELYRRTDDAERRRHEFPAESLLINSRKYLLPFLFIFVFFLSSFFFLSFVSTRSMMMMKRWSLKRVLVNCVLLTPKNTFSECSHNSYLEGNQLTGVSAGGGERYFVTARHVIELDCYDGPKGTPIVTHEARRVNQSNFANVYKRLKSLDS